MAAQKRPKAKKAKSNSSSDHVCPALAVVQDTYGAPSISALLKALRYHMDRSQFWQSRQAEIDPGYYSQLERGYRKISVEKLSQIALSFGLSLSRFVALLEENYNAKVEAGLLKSDFYFDFAYPEHKRTFGPQNDPRHPIPAHRERGTKLHQTGSFHDELAEEKEEARIRKQIKAKRKQKVIESLKQGC